jgi:hypothetical protein
MVSAHRLTVISVLSTRSKFDQHIKQITARAFDRANLIHKCFVLRHTNTLMKTFITYMRPLLEYASCVWSITMYNDSNQET